MCDTYKSYNVLILVKFPNIPLEIWNNVVIKAIGYGIRPYNTISDDGYVENNLCLMTLLKKIFQFKLRPKIQTKY